MLLVQAMRGDYAAAPQAHGNVPQLTPLEDSSPFERMFRRIYGEEPRNTASEPTGTKASDTGTTDTEARRAGEAREAEARKTEKDARRRAEESSAKGRSDESEAATRREETVRKAGDTEAKQSSSSSTGGEHDSEETSGLNDRVEGHDQGPRTGSDERTDRGEQAHRTGGPAKRINMRGGPGGSETEATTVADGAGTKGSPEAELGATATTAAMMKGEKSPVAGAADDAIEAPESDARSKAKPAIADAQADGRPAQAEDLEQVKPDGATDAKHDDATDRTGAARVRDTASTDRETAPTRRSTQGVEAVGERAEGDERIDRSARYGANGADARARTEAGRGDDRGSRTTVIDLRDAGRGEQRDFVSAMQKSNGEQLSEDGDSSDFGLRYFRDGRTVDVGGRRTQGAEGGRSFARMMRETMNPEIVRQSSIVLKNNGHGEIRMTLRPEHLGNLRVRLEIEDNRVTGRIIVDNAMVKESIEQNLDDLTRAFREQGYDDAALDVAVGGGKEKGRRNPSDDRSASAQDGIKSFDEATPTSEMEYESTVNLMV